MTDPRGKFGPGAKQDPPADDLGSLSKEQLIALVNQHRVAQELAEGELARAKATNEAVALLTSNVQEVYSRTIKTENDKGEEVNEELWKYRVELPASAGEGLKISGMPIYHGQTVEVNIDTLRTIKDMVHRAWYHEKSIFGQANDNAFRQGYMNNGSMVNTVLSMRPGWAGSRV